MRKALPQQYKAKNPSMPNTEFLGLRVPPDLAQALENEARAIGVTLPEFLRMGFISQTFHRFPEYRFDNSETIVNASKAENLQTLIPFFDNYFKQVKEYFEMVDKWRANIGKAEEEYQKAKEKLLSKSRKQGKSTIKTKKAA